MMETTLVEMFKHNQWANLGLLDVCAGLSAEQLEAGAVGTYGRLQDTLVHLLAAEERYVTELRGEPAEQPLRESEGFPGFAALRARAQDNGEALIKIAAEDPFKQMLQGNHRGQPFTMRAFVPLIQAIHHAHEHRAHVLVILTQLGIEPPDLSGWAYGDAMQYIKM